MSWRAARLEKILSFLVQDCSKMALVHCSKIFLLLGQIVEDSPPMPPPATIMTIDTTIHVQYIDRVIDVRDV